MHETARSAMLIVQMASLCEIGERSINQDALACAQRDHLTCLVVADGAGGHVGGEVASRLVVDAIIDSFLRELSFGPRALQSYLQRAAEAVAIARKETSLADMSATVAVVLIDQDNHCAVFGHLGDTRIYLFRAGTLHHVTKDHSLVQQFVDAGYVTADKMRTHPQRSVLFAAIGPQHDQAPIISTEPLALMAGDTLLICTDGLWEWLSDADMLECLQQSQCADDWLAALKAQAACNSKGVARSRDNYSAQAIWFVSSSDHLLSS
jgi:serine/threonine protein phosphatase PrpC